MTDFSGFLLLNDGIFFGRIILSGEYSLNSFDSFGSELFLIGLNVLEPSIVTDYYLKER